MSSDPTGKKTTISSEGKRMARVFAFVNFMSVFLVTWLVLMGDFSLKDTKIWFAYGVFVFAGFISAIVASMEVDDAGN